MKLRSAKASGDLGPKKERMGKGRSEFLRRLEGS